MRDIKFRLWIEKEHKMILDTFVVYPQGLIFKMDKGHSNVIGAYLTTDVALEQYTGLKDKNGVEIYEGDVIEILNNNYGYGHPDVKEHLSLKVTYSASEAAFLLDDNMLGEYLNCDMKVIGNIHEATQGGGTEMPGS